MVYCLRCLIVSSWNAHPYQLETTQYYRLHRHGVQCNRQLILTVRQLPHLRRLSVSCVYIVVSRLWTGSLGAYSSSPWAFFTDGSIARWSATVFQILSSLIFYVLGNTSDILNGLSFVGLQQWLQMLVVCRLQTSEWYTKVTHFERSSPDLLSSAPALISFADLRSEA